MAENSKIEWTDHTVNFWWGCEKVSPACAHCYAEGQAARFHPGHWGPGSLRWTRLTQARNEAIRYERKAVAQGRRFRVFTNSMSDFFEDRRDLDGARMEALDTIRQTPHLDWLILTKRPERIIELLWIAANQAHTLIYPPRGRDLHDWIHSWISAGIDGQVPANVWLGTTVENQEWADKRIPALLQVPAAVRFLSCEPLLGPVDLGGLILADRCGGVYPFPQLPSEFQTKRIDWLDWVICGGESGPHARPMHPDWARGLRDQCAAVGVPFLFKQWGEFAPALPEDNAANHEDKNAVVMHRLGKHAAGRLLDGVEHNGYPEVHHA